jgi:formylmethanofuran dehydrogenase subunit E
MTTQHIPPEWAFEFHGHQCPFMPIGYRMGRLALEKLGIEREKDHGFFVFPELGEAHPQTCMMDGIQAATGATYGKLLIAKTFYGISG